MNPIKNFDREYTYVPDVKSSFEKKKYAEWLKENGKDSGTSYAAALTAARTKLQQSLPTYGAVAERVNSIGLSKAGYSEYLKSAAENAYKRSVKEATDKRDAIDTENEAAYRSYSEAYDKDQAEKLRRVISTLAATDKLDYGAMLKLGVESGLSEKNAKAAAKAGYESVLSKLRRIALSTVEENGHDFEDAYNYGISLGLPEDEALYLAAYAESVHYSNVNDDYLSNLK